LNPAIRRPYLHRSEHLIPVEQQCYFEEEQRSDAGCSGGRMPGYFRHTTPGRVPARNQPAISAREPRAALRTRENTMRNLNTARRIGVKFGAKFGEAT
jgi:hypothetical protein